MIYEKTHIPFNNKQLFESRIPFCGILNPIRIIMSELYAEFR